MLQLAARDQISCGQQFCDHRVVGVALFAFVVDHALARKAWRLGGIIAVGVHGVGDIRVDAARDQFALVAHPNVKVVAAVAGRGVDKAGSGVVGYMVAVKQRHVEFITSCAMVERMRTGKNVARIDGPHALEILDAR